MNGTTTTAQMNGVTVNSSGLFVAVGQDLTTSVALYATSTDGSTWTTPAAMNGTTLSGVINAVTVNSSNKFVAVGGSGTALYATSTNGSTWTTPARMNSSAVATDMYGVTWSSALGLFVAVGYNTFTPAAGYYATSIDGSTWTTPTAMSGTASMSAIAVNSSGTFVSVGYDSSNANAPVYAVST